MSRVHQDISSSQLAMPDDYVAPPPSKCAKFLYYTWKFCSVIFSHFVMICLVIAYCILGAFTFEWLEAEHEREIKHSISWIRGNVTQDLWSFTNASDVLRRDTWTVNVSEKLKNFESEILQAMKQDGWDGYESVSRVQWTFTGALFYSIIVITTIGYGHIAPKTQTGKVVTIFYAILGIPLMLLCLSSIGDVMASSFRFLYWRMCCYVCTRPPKRRRRRALSRHPSTHRSVRGARKSMRRRPRPLTANAPQATVAAHAHSDTECRYRDSGYATAPSSARTKRSTPASPRGRSQPPAPAQPPHRLGRGLKRTRSFQVDGDHTPVMYNRHAREERYADDDNFPKISLPLDDLQAALYDLEQHERSRPEDIRSKSLPRPPRHRDNWGQKQPNYREQFGDERPDMRNLRDVDYDNYRERQAQIRDKRNLEEFDDIDNDYDPDDDLELDRSRDIRQYDRESRWGRGHSEYYDSRADWEYPDYTEPDRRRARSMMYDERRGYDPEMPPRRQYRRLDTREETGRKLYRYSMSPERRRGRSEAPPQSRRRDWEEDWSDDDEQEFPARHKERQQAWASRQSELQLQGNEHTNKPQIKPVPIWLCVFLVFSYIIAGAFLFHKWEAWPLLDSAYFCFITLTTIGFGDFVPAQGIESKDAAESIALCSLYLLFGISLLAMSFNLVQEEVIANVRAVAKKLGIIKPDEEDSDSE